MWGNIYIYTRAPGDRILSSEKSSDIFQGIMHSQVGIFYLLNVMIKNLILPIYIYMKSSIFLRFKSWICIQTSIWFSAGIFYLSGSHIYIYRLFVCSMDYYIGKQMKLNNQVWRWQMQNISIWCSAGIFYLLGLCVYIYICIYIYKSFLYVPCFTISNEEWTLTFQVVILYGFILYGLYVYMCIYIHIYANKPCLCEAFYLKTMVFLCGDMQALLISERQNQKLYWQSHSVEAFQGYTILVYGIFYLFSFRLTFIKII